jgi:hypothetical protein
MIGGGGTSAQYQFGKTDERTGVHGIGREFCPNRIKRFEPVKQIGVLRGRNCAC